MAKCARCENDAVTRVRYQTQMRSMEVCENHHHQYQQAAQSAGLRLVYDDGLNTGLESAAELLTALRKLNDRMDRMERGEPAQPAKKTQRQLLDEALARHGEASEHSEQP